MSKPIEQRAREALGAEHPGPLIEGQVAGNDDRHRNGWVSQRQGPASASRENWEQLGPR